MKISKLAHTIPLFPKTKRTPEKFWELADVHMNFLYNMALRYAGNRYDAEDLVQETFYVGLKKFFINCVKNVNSKAGSLLFYEIRI